MFIDATKYGDVTVKEYESERSNYAVLLCLGEQGPSIKISSEQAQTLHSALLRMYECVQS